ncbi:MAG TPA: hypothetical protein VGM54_13230 [Chthoniobacter sp.]|jgi:hypothetical protein
MINQSKLKNVVQKDGKIEAQCPACQQAGADSKGNHLVVYPDGEFGCVANPGDKEHNKQILKLVGDKSYGPPPQLQIRRQVIPDSQVILKVGRSGQKNPSPAGTGEYSASETPAPAEAEKTGPNCPEDEISTEEAA